MTDASRSAASNGPPGRPPLEEGDLSIRAISARMRPAHVGPLQRLTIFASGVPSRLVEVVPVERTEFLVQGTGVLVAAALAFVGGWVTTGLLWDPPPSTLARLAIAFGFAALIFTVDRLLVRSPLRPYHFPKHVLHTLWDPSADAKWFDVLAGSVQRESAFAKLRAAIGVFAKVALRVALAACVSYLVADLIVVSAFKPAVDARATAILVQQQQDATSRAQQKYNDAVDAANKQQQAAIASLDKIPAVGAANQLVQTLSTAVANLAQDVDKLQSVADAESQGVQGVRVTLSDQTSWPADPRGTTGKSGCAKECHDLNDLLQKKQTELGQQQQALQQARQAQSGAATTAGAGSLVSNATQQQQTEIQNAATIEGRDLAKAQAMPTQPQGLLIRRTALHQLEQDTTPWTDELNGQAACSGGFKWLCTLQRAVLPSTPLGSYVAIFRAILFLIDILPITLKIYYSLRGRRPFDVLLAALEEASVADSMNKLDHELNVVGGQMERRAVDRRGERTGQGARLIRHAATTERRERERLERRIRDQVRIEFAERGPGVPARLRAWRRSMTAIKLKTRRPNAILVMEREDSPWAQPRSFEPPMGDGS